MNRIEVRRVFAALLCIAAPLSQGLAAQDAASGGSVREALRQAAKTVAAVKGLKGEQRTTALVAAAKAYEQVIASYPDAREGCATAWFQVGEIARRRGELAEAELAYGKAAGLDGDRWGERALLQRGHMLRRLKRWDEAIVLYRQIGGGPSDSARCHQARCWLGKSLQSTGDVSGAVTEFERALGVTEKPRRVIELCNFLAKAQIAQGDLDAAAAAIARADKAVPAGGGEEVERAAKSAASMSARRALQRARDKQDGAARDAVDLEASRRRR